MSYYNVIIFLLFYDITQSAIKTDESDPELQLSLSRANIIDELIECAGVRKL